MIALGKAESERAEFEQKGREAEEEKLSLQAKNQALERALSSLGIQLDPSSLQPSSSLDFSV